MEKNDGHRRIELSTRLIFISFLRKQCSICREVPGCQRIHRFRRLSNRCLLWESLRKLPLAPQAILEARFHVDYVQLSNSATLTTRKIPSEDIRSSPNCPVEGVAADGFRELTFAIFRGPWETFCDAHELIARDGTVSYSFTRRITARGCSFFLEHFHASFSPLSPPISRVERF